MAPDMYRGPWIGLSELSRKIQLDALNQSQKVTPMPDAPLKPVVTKEFFQCPKCGKESLFDTNHPFAIEHLNTKVPAKVTCPKCLVNLAFSDIKVVGKIQGN